MARKSGRRSAAPILVATVAGTMFLATACSGAPGGTDGDDAPTGATRGAAFDQELHDAVPAEYREDGVQVAAFNDWPPDEFVEDGELKGWSIDMADAIFEVLGVDYEIEGTTFDSILPGLKSGRYDAGFASFGVTEERLEVLDFIPQRLEGAGYASSADDPIEIDEATDLCGHSIATLTGAWDYQYLKEQSAEQCGDNPITLEQFTSQNAAELAVTSGRVEIVAAGSAKLQYVAQQAGTLYVADLLSNPVYNGIGVRQGDPLGESIRDAIQVLIDNGTYERIMADWGVDGQGMLDKAVLVTQDNPNP